MARRPNNRPQSFSAGGGGRPVTQIGTRPDGTPIYAPSRGPRESGTGETPPTYTQRFAQYGNRGQGVKQAAKDRKRLMEIRKATQHPHPLRITP